MNSCPEERVQIENVDLALTLLCLYLHRSTLQHLCLGRRELLVFFNECAPLTVCCNVQPMI